MGKMDVVMREFRKRKLRSGSKKGPVVRKRSQAVAIGLSEAREAGEDVPPPRKRSRAVSEMIGRRR